MDDQCFISPLRKHQCESQSTVHRARPSCIECFVVINTGDEVHLDIVNVLALFPSCGENSFSRSRMKAVVKHDIDGTGGYVSENRINVRFHPLRRMVAEGKRARVPSENLVRSVVIEDFPDLDQAASTMIPALLAVFASFRSLFRSRVACPTADGFSKGTGGNRSSSATAGR